MAHDVEEQLEAAKADVVAQERELAKLRAVLARVVDYARDEAEEAAKWEESGERAEIVRGSVARAVLGLVDEAAAPERDLSPLSGISRNGVRQTWQQVAIDREERLRQLEACATMLADLDRNRNGRHEGDVDSGAVSLGNPHLSTGQTIGYSLHGRFAYVVPEPRLRGDVEAWKKPRK
jgi:hypothetical protein